MDSNQTNRKINEFVTNYKSLLEINKRYNFKHIDVSIDEIVNWAIENDKLGMFIDSKMEERDGVFLIKNPENSSYELKICNNGFVNSASNYDDLIKGIKAKLEAMEKVHLIFFKSNN